MRVRRSAAHGGPGVLRRGYHVVGDWRRWVCLHTRRFRAANGRTGETRRQQVAPDSAGHYGTAAGWCWPSCESTGVRARLVEQWAVGLRPAPLMGNAGRRNRWGLHRLLRSHIGEPGVVVYGRFGRLRGWVPSGDWEAVVVKVDGQQRAILDQLNRGPAWIGVDEGTRRVEFVGGRRVLRAERIEVTSQRRVLVTFEPPRRRWTGAMRPERWYVLLLD